MRQHLIPVRMAITKKSTNSKWQIGCGENGTLPHCWWKHKLAQPLQKTVQRLLNTLKAELLYDPALPLLGKHMEKTVIQKGTCIPMFVAALVTIAQTQKQPKCPTIEVWIKTMRHMYTVEHYSALKKNEITPFATTWMQLESIILSEGRQKE